MIVEESADKMINYLSLEKSSKGHLDEMDGESHLLGGSLRFSNEEDVT